MEIEEFDPNYLNVMKIKNQAAARVLMTQVRVDENALRRKGVDLLSELQDKASRAMKDLEKFRPAKTIDGNTTP